MNLPKNNQWPEMTLYNKQWPSHHLNFNCLYFLFIKLDMRIFNAHFDFWDIELNNKIDQYTIISYIKMAYFKQNHMILLENRINDYSLICSRWKFKQLNKLLLVIDYVSECEFALYTCLYWILFRSIAHSRMFVQKKWVQ